MERLCEIENLKKSLCKPKCFINLNSFQLKDFSLFRACPRSTWGDKEHKNLSFCEMVMAVNDSCFPFECPSLAS